MGSDATWCAVMLAVASATVLTLRLGESVWVEGRFANRGTRVVAILCSAAALLVLALVLRVRTIAEADGHVVSTLARSRGDLLAQIMSVVTTMGDAVPSFTLAAVLAVTVYRQGAHPLACVMLPVVVLVQLIIQFAVGHVFGDFTISDVAPDIPVGGGGYLPSGSVARLSCIFLLTAHLWYVSNRRQSAAILTFGSILVIVEVVTRLYLGRHLILDIPGGLALGLFLYLVVSLALPRSAGDRHGVQAR